MMGGKKELVKERDRSCIVDVAQGAEGSRSAVRDFVRDYIHEDT